MNNYKDFVQKMLNIDWSKTSDDNILFLSTVTAIEFAQSLRLANIAYPENKGIKAMSKEELMTDNLKYGKQTNTGDHVDFLLNGLLSEKILFSIDKILLVEGLKYLSTVGKLTPKERSMTVFSRESELPNIFKNLLSFPLGSNLDFYKYYLEQHILLDSQDGGHADMISSIPLDEKTLEKYYKLRLNFYEAAFSSIP